MTLLSVLVKHFKVSLYISMVSSFKVCLIFGLGLAEEYYIINLVNSPRIVHVSLRYSTISGGNASRDCSYFPSVVSIEMSWGR